VADRVRRFLGNDAPKAGDRVECVLEDGTRVGPLEVVECTGNHAFVKLDTGISMPLPIRTLVPAKTRRRTGSSSGERTAAR
jgi:hypothetical protein